MFRKYCKNKLKNSESGAAAIELCFTLPIILSLIFFILEMVKVNNAKTAMETMAAEATFYFAKEKNTTGFADIITRHKPAYVKNSSIRYYFAVYENLEAMCKASPYGGEDIYWIGDETAKQSNPSTYLKSSSSFICRNGDLAISNIVKPETSNTNFRGKVFVLTFVCDYTFSSKFVADLFAGGTNTNDKKKYLLWGRGCGICSRFP
ncbi:MAG: pilus assembly protein [Holosporaceae bacterium]|nr:pilus assembly protein [Holosporaceae bacterium]